MAPPPRSAQTPPPSPVKAEPVTAVTRSLSIADAESELEAAQALEQDVELELEKLYNKAAHLCQSESRNLAIVSEHHKQVPAAIRKLQETLSQTSGVADELSGRVRKLDSVLERVAEALKIVDDMLDLRECSDQVMKAITSEDYEQAARYVARFRALQDTLPTGTDDTSVRVMREAEQQLSVIVRKRFEAAMSAKDAGGVSRYAKLFHPLGLAGEGVQKYVQFIRQSLAEKCAEEFKKLSPAFGRRADDEPSPYAETLTADFMAIADLVQEHQQNVEEEFGPANFVIVLRGLQEEADIQGLRVIDKFESDHTRVFEQSGSIEMSEVGAVLEEAAMLTQRTQQFSAYMHNIARDVVQLIEERTAFVSALPEGHSETDGLAETSRLTLKIQKLMNKFVEVEQTFVLMSVNKAINSTDKLDPDDPDDLTSTFIDDTFFILRECMMRACMTSDIQAVCAMVNVVNNVLSQEVKAALANNLAESKRLYAPWVSHMDYLSPPDNGEHPLATLWLNPEGHRRSPLTSAFSWPHSLNNLQQCVENMDSLKAATQDSFDQSFPEEGDDADKRPMFHNLLQLLDATKGELEDLHSTKCKEGLQMFKCHLSPMLQRLDDKVDYQMTEGKYMDCQVNDPFAKQFIGVAMLIHQHLKAVLNSTSCEEFMQHMADQTCKRVEKTVLTKKFTIFGALQFDTDVRALCSFFTSVSEQALRHKFARLLEMTSLVTLENANELRELYSETRTWRLAPDEIRKLLGSRIDLDVTQGDLDLLLPH